MTKKDREFVAVVYDFYQQQGRHDLPWRQTTDPYAIMVSELMLQQTQVVRVIPKYQAFIDTFPTIKKLADAPLSAVLIAWQGLGYNRRAKLLHECAQVIQDEYQGQVPKNEILLKTLPGVGPYTAGAIMAFAYNTPVVMLETNIRTVYLYHYYKDQTGVSDRELAVLVARTLDKENPRAWYAALMDYGSYLKQTEGNNIKQSAQYKKQSTFRGSQREVRGAIVRTVARERSVTTASLRSALPQFDHERLSTALTALLAEGLLVSSRRRYRLPGIDEPQSRKNPRR